MGRINRFIWFLIMIIIGGCAGLYYSWYIKPAEFVDAALFNLRPDYKTDYVLMVAEIYDMEHDRFQALVRLDNILAPSDPSRESVVEAAIENAQNLGYNPIDLQKMYRLQEVISGERNVPTETIDPTMLYAFEQTSTVSAIQNVENAPTSTPAPENGSVPVADSDPFNTGVRITTDPNAVPMLDLTPAPFIIPNSASEGSESERSSSSLDNAFDDPGFGGFSDNFYFGGD
jgi:hypothetical protein